MCFHYSRPGCLGMDWIWIWIYSRPFCIQLLVLYDTANTAIHRHSMLGMPCRIPNFQLLTPPPLASPYYLVDDKTHTPLHRWPGENLLRSSSIYIFGMASYLLSRQLALSLQRNLWLGAPGKSHTTLFEYICFSLLPCSFSLCGHALLQMPPEQKCGTAS